MNFGSNYRLRSFWGGESRKASPAQPGAQPPQKGKERGRSPARTARDLVRADRSRGAAGGTRPPPRHTTAARPCKAARSALAEGAGLTAPAGLAGACVAVVSPGGCRAPRDAQRDSPRRSRARRGRASGAPAPQPPRCARRATRGAPKRPPRRRAGLLAAAAALRAAGQAERASRAATQPRGARGQQRDTARPLAGRARSAAPCSPRSGCTGRHGLAGAGRVRRASFT